MQGMCDKLPQVFFGTICLAKFGFKISKVKL